MNRRKNRRKSATSSTIVTRQLRSRDSIDKDDDVRKVTPVLIRLKRHNERGLPNVIDRDETLSSVLYNSDEENDTVANSSPAKKKTKSMQVCGSVVITIYSFKLNQTLFF